MFGTHSTNWDMSLPPKALSKQPQVNSFLPSFSTMDWTWGLGYVSGLLYQWVTAPGFFLVGQSDSLEKNFLNSSFKWSLSILRAQGKRTRCLHAAHPHYLLTVWGAISSEPVVPCSIIRRWTIYPWGRGKLLLGCMENGGWHRSTCFWTHFYPVLIYLLISTQSSSLSIFLFF